MLLAVTPQKLSRPVIRQHMLSWCHTYIRHHMLSWCQTYSKASYSVLHRSTSDALPPSSTGLSYTCPPRARCLSLRLPRQASVWIRCRTSPSTKYVRRAVALSFGEVLEYPFTTTMGCAGAAAMVTAGHISTRSDTPPVFPWGLT